MMAIGQLRAIMTARAVLALPRPIGRLDGWATTLPCGGCCQGDAGPMAGAGCPGLGEGRSRNSGSRSA